MRTMGRMPAEERVAAERTWQLQTAKAQFSELFRLAITEGPQRVTRSGKDAVIVLPERQYLAMKARRKAKRLSEFFAESPFRGVDLESLRSRDEAREVEW